MSLDVSSKKMCPLSHSTYYLKAHRIGNNMAPKLLAQRQGENVIVHYKLFKKPFQARLLRVHLKWSHKTTVPKKCIFKNFYTFFMAFTIRVNG